MRTCVIGHTQDLQKINDLPPRAQLALTEADLVLHVGSVGSLTFLRALQDAYGLIVAIHGVNDPDELKRYLELNNVVEVAGRRVGMVFNAMQSSGRGLSLSGRRRPSPEVIAEQALAQFERVDCVVFGSPEESFNRIHNGILILNPGPVVKADGLPGTMGLLEVTERAITGRIVPL